MKPVFFNWKDILSKIHPYYLMRNIISESVVQPFLYKVEVRFCSTVYASFFIYLRLILQGQFYTNLEKNT